MPSGHGWALQCRNGMESLNLGGHVKDCPPVIGHHVNQPCLPLPGWLPLWPGRLLLASAGSQSAGAAVQGDDDGEGRTHARALQEVSPKCCNHSLLFFTLLGGIVMRWKNRATDYRR